ncbi:MAG: BtpA/SgcQ family protein [Candidatus Hodarchaeota archaeon]
MILESVFGKTKAVIGMVHLLPLPGSPQTVSLDTVLKQALDDTKALELGGVDALLIENFGDLPYCPDQVGAETVAAMTYIVSKIAEQTSLPFGINVLRNDGIAALSITSVCSGHFIRVNVLTGVYITDQGIIKGQAYRILRHRTLLNSEVLIFADIHVKHAIPIPKSPIERTARETVNRGLADAVIVTGEETGKPPSLDDVKSVRKSLQKTPILIGSGVDINNIETFLDLTDGVIVGTSFKVDNDAKKPVDIARVRNFMKKVNKIT